MSITSTDHHATLRHEERDALGTTLQSVLHEVIKVVTALLVQAGGTTRRAAEQAAEYDAVTQDLLNQVIHTLEKHAWMFAAQGRA